MAYLPREKLKLLSGLMPRGMINNVMVVLQHSLDLLKAECSSSTEACPMSSYDTEQVTRVKVEHITDTQKEEDPLQITCPSVKREREVSCVRIIIINTGHRHSACQTVCPHDTTPLW